MKGTEIKKDLLTKIETIIELCSEVIYKEKNKQHAEIRINRERTCVLIKNKVLGYVTELKPNEFKFQYVID